MDAVCALFGTADEICMAVWDSFGFLIFLIFFLLFLFFLFQEVKKILMAVKKAQHES